MRHMLAHGFSKYDDFIGVAPTPEASVDAGVLSIRDFILSTQADLYVTCQGEHCRQCFRDNSNIVERIIAVRRLHGLPLSQNWFDFSEKDVPSSFFEAAV